MQLRLLKQLRLVVKQTRLKQVLLLAAVAFSFPVFAAGCNMGREIVPVSGVVKINGKPLTGAAGFVRLEPDDYRPAFGKINPEDGTFELTTKTPGDGCAMGEHPVAVIVNVTRGPRLISLIPAKYTETATSGLTATIDGATDSLVIDLEGELKKAPSTGGDIYMGDDPGDRP